MLEPGSTDGVATRPQIPCPRSYGVSTPLTVVRDLPTLASPQQFRSSRSMPRGECSLLSMLPDLAGRHLREPERMCERRDALLSGVATGS